MASFAIGAFLCLFVIPSLASAAIYWANGEQIGRANIDGSNANPRFLFHGLGQVCGVAVDATHIYWADRQNNVIGRADLDGSNSNPWFIEGADSPCGVAVDGSHIYWANQGQVDYVDGHDGFIGRASLDGTAVDHRFVEPAHGACGVAVNSTHLYWASWVTESIGRASIDGTGSEPGFIEDPGGACGIALNSEHLYWGTFESTIGRARLDGEEPDPDFISGLERPCGVAVNDSHLFWTEQWVEGWVGRAALVGSEVTRGLVSGRSFPCGVAVDSLPAPPLTPPPVPAENTHCGITGIRHNEWNGTAVIAVQADLHGVVRIKTRGLGWRQVSPKTPPPPHIGGSGRRSLRIWPAAKGSAATRIRRQLRESGRARLKLRLWCVGEGRHTIPATRVRPITLRRTLKSLRR